LAEETARRRLYEDQIRFLRAGDVEGLIDNQYTDDATLVSFDTQVTGAAALKEHFRGYLEALGNLDVLSTDKFVETGDTIFFEAKVKTDLGEATVYDAWVLRGGKIAYHFTGVYP